MSDDRRPDDPVEPPQGPAGVDEAAQGGGDEPDVYKTVPIVPRRLPSAEAFFGAPRAPRHSAHVDPVPPPVPPVSVPPAPTPPAPPASPASDFAHPQALDLSGLRSAADAPAAETPSNPVNSSSPERSEPAAERPDEAHEGPLEPTSWSLSAEHDPFHLPQHDAPGETPTAAFGAVFGETPTAQVSSQTPAAPEESLPRRGEARDEPERAASFTELISVPGDAQPPAAAPSVFDWDALPAPSPAGFTVPAHDLAEDRSPEPGEPVEQSFDEQSADEAPVGRRVYDLSVGSEPERVASQPEPVASQPEPAAPQPEPGAPEPVPTAPEGPTAMPLSEPTAPDPAPAPAVASATSFLPVIDGAPTEEPTVQPEPAVDSTPDRASSVRDSASAEPGSDRTEPVTDLIVPLGDDADPFAPLFVDDPATAEQPAVPAEGESTPEGDDDPSAWADRPAEPLQPVVIVPGPDGLEAHPADEVLESPRPAADSDETAEAPAAVRDLAPASGDQAQPEPVDGEARTVVLPVPPAVEPTLPPAGSATLSTSKPPVPGAPILPTGDPATPFATVGSFRSRTSTPVEPVDLASVPQSWLQSQPPTPDEFPPQRAGGGGLSTWPRERRLLLFVGIVVAFVIVLGALFFLGRAVISPSSSSAATPVATSSSANTPKASTPSAPPSSAAPTAAATPTAPATTASGPVSVGVHPWSDLNGGECLSAFQNAWQQTYTVVDCGTPHVAQMTAKRAFPDAAGTAYPGQAALQSRMTLLCSASTVINLDAAKAYSDIQVAGSYPTTASQWDAGDRTYYCFADRANGATLTGSIAAS